MRAVLIAMVLSVLFAAGCGQDGGPATADDMALKLAAAIGDNAQGSIDDVRCVERDEHTFRCSGDYRASEQSVRDEMRSVDTSAFTAKDWKALVDGRSGLITFRVDVYDDGTFTYRPES